MVYKAWQEGLDRPVAVKVLLADLSDEGDERRFWRECTVLGRLGQHRHIVDVFDAGVTRDRRPYIVMKYYAGGTLAQRIRDSGPVPADEAVRMLADLAAAVQAGHDQGVVHRDIKPDNVLVEEDGSVVLADFGVAAWVDEDHTRTGSGAFSQAYAAPEVLEDNEYGPASDVYSLAASGYAMLTGRAPFHSTSGGRQLLAIVNDPPEPITTAGVSPALSDVLLGGMAKDPADRPRSPAELGTQLRAALTAQPAAEPRLTFCVECGAAIEGPLKFCPQCGHRQEPDRSATTTLRPAPRTTPSVPPVESTVVVKPAPRKVPVAAVVAVLLLLAIGGVAFAVLRPQDDLVRGTTSAQSPTAAVTASVTGSTPSATPTAATQRVSLQLCDWLPYPFDEPITTSNAAGTLSQAQGTGDTKAIRRATAVASIQSAWRTAGQRGPTNGRQFAPLGDFGPQGSLVVQQVQQTAGLPVTGDINARTWAELQDAYC